MKLKEYFKKLESTALVHGLLHLKDYLQKRN